MVEITSGPKIHPNSVTEFIEKNLHKKLDALVFAEYWGLSKPTIQRYFKMWFGKSVRQYINEKRMEKAVYFIENTNLNMSEISNLVGYRFASVFSVAFKRYYHISPKEYQDRFLERKANKS